MINNNKLYACIYKAIKDENDELLQLTEKGIFSVPELYIAVVIDKSIMKNSESIFETKVEWLRECRFNKELGPVDFAFNTEEQTYIFELKIRDTVQSYIKDIEKLKHQDESFCKYFIALTDCWKNKVESDRRIK